MLKAGWKKEDVERAIASCKYAMKDVQRKSIVDQKLREDNQYADKKLQEMLAEKKKDGIKKK